MAGMETVRIIVDAEKAAAVMLEKAQARAIEIRKGLDSRIREEREQILAVAKRDATAIVQRAEEEGKLEAEGYEKEAGQKIKHLVSKASAKESPAIDRLVSIVLEGKA